MKTSKKKKLKSLYILKVKFLYLIHFESSKEFKSSNPCS